MIEENEIENVTECEMCACLCYCCFEHSCLTYCYDCDCGDLSLLDDH